MRSKVADLRWASRGACSDPANEGVTWFWKDPEFVSDANRRICGSCPVRAECYDHAVSYPEMGGVWAGTSETDRAILRSAAHRARLQSRRLRLEAPGP